MWILVEIVCWSENGVLHSDQFHVHNVPEKLCVGITDVQ